MSHTDRAFIKAYGGELPPQVPFPQQQPSNPVAEETVVPAAASTTDAAESQETEPTDSTPENPKAFKLRADQPVERLPVPHMDRPFMMRSKETETAWDDLILPEERSVLTGETPMAQPTQADKESEDMEATITPNRSTALRSLSDSVGSTAKWNPQQQVDRFQLPAICQALLQVCEQDFLALAEQFAAHQEDGHRLIAVSSVEGNEGGTTFTLCLASQLAAQGLRVLVVDHDLGQPAIAEALGLEAEFGWNDVLSKDISLSDAVVVETDSNLAVLPSKKIADTANLGVPRQRLCFALMRQHYDFILVDVGPLRSLNDEQLRAPQFDAAVIVREAQVGPDQSLHTDLSRWQNMAVSVLGVIETFVPRSPLAASA